MTTTPDSTVGMSEFRRSAAVAGNAQPGKLPPITAPDCAEFAAAALRQAAEIASEPTGIDYNAASANAHRAASLVKVADGYRDLGVALDQHYGLVRDTDEQQRR